MVGLDSTSKPVEEKLFDRLAGVLSVLGVFENVIVSDEPCIVDEFTHNDGKVMSKIVVWFHEVEV